eukprot:UN12911
MFFLVGFSFYRNGKFVANFFHSCSDAIPHMNYSEFKFSKVC